MSGHPSPGLYNNRPMNGGPNLHHHHQFSSPGNARYNNHPVAPDVESHYSNPYSDHQHNGTNIQNNSNYNNKNGSDKMAIHRPRLNRKNAAEDKGKSSLTTNFDPMKDRHMWAMWRTAVNGRIVDQVRKNEQSKQDAMLPPDDYSSSAGDSDTKTTTPVYGKDLASAPPLSRFIRLNERSKNIAQELMNEGQGKLETTQFIYYGLPRVTVNTANNNRYIHNSNNHHNNNNNNNINGAPNGYGGIPDQFSNMKFYNGEVGGPRMQHL